MRYRRGGFFHKIALLKKEPRMIRDFASNVGRTASSICDDLGRFGVFSIDVFSVMFSTKLRVKKVVAQIIYIGVKSLSIVILVGSAIGAVLAIQSFVGLERFSASQFIGPVVFLSMAREFGPVFAALMVIGRAGSAITAEIGTMRITEQIDALQTLCINPYQYLVVPRVVAGTIILPLLSLFCSVCGIVAGYVVSVYLLGINGEVYQETIRTHVELFDIVNGLIKAVVFGLLFGLISTYKGYITRGGAKGVGIATTQSVVFANVTIVVADYILGSLMLK